MACSRMSRLVAVCAAGSLFMGSTAAVAAGTPSAAPQVNPWAALTALSAGAPAAAVCGAAAVAAQAPAGCVLPVLDTPAPVAQTAPPPPAPVPPVEPVGGGFGFSPLLLGLGAIALGALIYFVLIKGNGHHDNDVSPA